MTCLLPAVAVRLITFPKLSTVSFGLRQSNDARGPNKLSQCISGLFAHAPSTGLHNGLP